MAKRDLITSIFQSAPLIPFDNTSRFVILSDIHRGDGSWADDFSRNQLLFYAALTHYYQENYTYIELGDGDELWENKNIIDIMHTYSNIFLLMKRFYLENRFYMLYGNHDIEKQDPRFVEKYFYDYYDRHKDTRVELFPGLQVHQGLVLQHTLSKKKVFLIHGHQPDLLNNQLWKLGRFLVRYLWRPFESIGMRNPFITANSDKRKTRVERSLIQWASQNQQILIAGHTHRTAFAKPGEAPYYNDGTCIHLRYITGIEITNSAISLVKWSLKTKTDGTIYVDKDLLAGPQSL